MIMKKTLSYIVGAMMLLIPSMAGAQALPFTVVDADPVILAKGGAGLTETGSVSNAAFTNAAVIPFSESTLDVSAGYMMWQPGSVNTNVINAGAAFNLGGKLGVAAGLYYGMNPEYNITNGSGVAAGTFKPSDLHAAVGLSYRFLGFMSFGVNFGYATSSLAEGQSYGSIAGDAFVMAKIAGLKVTAGVSNVLGSIKSASGTKFSLPASAALGAGYGLTLGKSAIEANLDVDYFFSGDLAAAFGAGYTFNDLVSVRAGYRYGGDSSPIPSYASVGAGVKFLGIKLDAAYLIASGPMANTLALSLGFCF